VLGDRTFTSTKADEIISALCRATTLEYATLARIAMMYSLKTRGRDVSRSEEWSGREIRWVSTLAGDASVIRGLFSVVYEQEFDEDDLFSKICLAKDHMDQGLLLLGELFDSCDRNPTAFLMKLAERVPTSLLTGGTAAAIDLVIGTDSKSGQEVVMKLNDTGVHANPHLAIAGKPGVGKTQFLLKLIADVRVHTDCKTGSIIFDYKGDIAANERFVEVSRATVCRLPSDTVPINPFVLAEYTDDAIKMSAREKAESFSSIDGRFGPVQKGALSRAIERAYANRETEERRYPDFAELLQIVLEDYEAEGKREDTLTEILRDLANFNLFWSHSQGDEPISSLLDRALVVDLSGLSVLKELVAYLVIERLYKEMSRLPDSALEGDRRQVRTILVIDEAHNYLPHKNLFLQRVVREGRSKGIAVFFASQSPSDYLQKEFDFRELLEFFFMFQCDGLSAAQIQGLIGCSPQVAKSLQTETPRLQPFEVVAKPMTRDAPLLRFRAIPFHTAYE